jgi:hypothetical protein
MTIAPAREPRDRGRPATGLARYAREIVVVLVVKAIAMVVIWNVWFAGSARNGVSADRVAERLYTSSPQAQEGATHARP